MILYSSVQTLFGLNKDYGLFLARTVLKHMPDICEVGPWKFHCEFGYKHDRMGKKKFTSSYLGIYIEKLKLHMKIISGDAFQRFII